MNKLKEYINKWLDGKKIKGINVSLYDIQELIRIYNAIIRKENPILFINGNVKKILDRCNIKSVGYGNGWKII